MVINNDVEIKDRITAVKINKQDFITKFFEYVTSERILEIAKNNKDVYVEDIIDEIDELKTEDDIKIRTMDAILILLDANDRTSVNNYGVSNCGLYGYNSYNTSQYPETDIANYLGTDKCSEGLFTFDNGITMWFVSCLDDEMVTINVAIYYDGTDFRFYVPIHGNYVNTIYKQALGLGEYYVGETYKESAKEFMDNMMEKTSKEELSKATEFIDHNDEYINELLIDILYLAKYNKCFGEDRQIRDLITNEQDEVYDVDAIADEIKLVFSINTETKEMNLFEK